MPDRQQQRQRKTARYSKFVARIKVLLPLLALVILSTVFLLGDGRRLDRALTFSDADFEALGQTDVLARARFAGATVNGDYLSFSTLRLAPDPSRENVLLFDKLSGSIQFADGQEATLLATVAEFFVSDNRIVMPDGGAITTSQGYRGRTETMQAALTGGDISGTGLDGSGPLGEITAGSFEIRESATENRVLWFGQGVRLKLHQQVNTDNEGALE
ncbi:MAG: hypothetical protein WD046_12685 [Paracoccaceae bacterium]